MSNKLKKNKKKKQKTPLFNSQETSWPGPPVKDYWEEESNVFPPEDDWNQELFDFTPSPFSIKQF